MTPPAVTDRPALAEGDQMPDGGPVRITRTSIVRYAGAGGDFNPIHHDEQFAQQAGVPGVFAMGMLHAGMLAQRLARWAGVRNVKTYSIRFTGIVWPDDELTFEGQVDRTFELEGQPVADITLAVKRNAEERVIAGRATVFVR